MASRLRASMRLALVFYALMPALTAVAQERATGSDLPKPALNAAKADEPPPLHFDQKPVMPTPPPVPVRDRWERYTIEIGSRFNALFQGDSLLAHSEASWTAVISIGPQGRITQARLIGSSGDHALDTRFRDRVLAKFTPPPPPKDLPMPYDNMITLRGKRFIEKHDR